MKNIFHYYYTKGFFWFRIFGYGLCFKNTKIHGFSFSERRNHRQFLIFDGWIIISLRP